MAEPFLGEIRIFGFNFAPTGWALCNGQTMSIAQNTALFALLGTTYGGDGIETFALPNLQSRVAIHMGQGTGLSPYDIGEEGGSESVVLNALEMPEHTHAVGANGAAGTSDRPAGNVPARTKASAYGSAPDGTTMNASMIGNAGGNQPHENRQPFLVVNFCIALQGIFPSRN
jgi:microcystin-dependent protein